MSRNWQAHRDDAAALIDAVSGQESEVLDAIATKLRAARR
jgi:hypothetical protein